MVLDLTVLAPASASRVEDQAHAALAGYVAAAGQLGLRVEALAGDPDLVTDLVAVTAINESLGAYNEKYPEQRISYLVWDVEPWQYSTWDPADFLDYARFALAGTAPGITPGFAVPVWFTGTHAEQMSWSGASSTMGAHLARIVAQREGAFVAVMDYFDDISAARSGLQPWLELGVPVRSVFEIGRSERGTTMLGWTWPEQSRFLNEVSRDWVGLEVYQGLDVDSALYLPGLPGGLSEVAPNTAPLP